MEPTAAGQDDEPVQTSAIRGAGQPAGRPSRRGAGQPTGAKHFGNYSGGFRQYAAMQEQLGLKLDSTKSPVEVMVIDHVEKPSPN